MAIKTLRLTMAVVLLLMTQEGAGRDIVSAPNRRTKLCPEGTVYRSGCQLCFCIDSETRCDSDFPTKEKCDDVTRGAHCRPDRLLYNYEPRCEGSCTCNEARNVTVCERLPCSDSLLWFYGFYDHPGVEGVALSEPAPLRLNSMLRRRGHKNTPHSSSSRVTNHNEVPLVMSDQDDVNMPDEYESYDDEMMAADGGDVMSSYSDDDRRLVAAKRTRISLGEVGREGPQV